mmetsp:Transcript_11890/g.15142  ORF Transcript_11890/g.15142 Transcript_11890/m.15142 type:complete len:146 (+) Transcript_11890:30-467(+)
MEANPFTLRHWFLRMDNDAEDFPDDQCKPNQNNWIPCVCVPSYMIVIASIEMCIFLTTFCLFFYQSHKKQKKIDPKTFFLVLMFFIAFVMHYSYLWYAFMGPSHCRTMHVTTSFVFFFPQAIFFLIFIWTIFKLLLVWRGMASNS